VNARRIFRIGPIKIHAIMVVVQENMVVVVVQEKPLFAHERSMRQFEAQREARQQRSRRRTNTNAAACCAAAFGIGFAWMVAGTRSHLYRTRLEILRNLVFPL